MACIENCWSVYLHISPTQKYYVGVTKFKPNQRWGKQGRRYKDQVFYNAILKYGWENMRHIVIGSHLCETDAKELEKKWIKILGSNSKDNGYNLTAGGDGTVGVSHYGADNPFYGRKHSDDSRRKMSESRERLYGVNNSFYGHRHSTETKKALSAARSIPVCQFDTDMNFLQEYPSIKVASQETGVWQSMIGGCCKQLTGYKTAGGFIWIYKSDLHCVNTNEYRENFLHEKLPKPICQLTHGMDYIERYQSIGEAARATGIFHSNITNAATGVAKQAGGFIWIFEEDYQKMQAGEIPMHKPFNNDCYKPVIQYSLDMEFISEFRSRREAADSIGVSPQAIGYACKSKSHQSKGYIWKFKEEVG